MKWMAAGLWVLAAVAPAHSHVVHSGATAGHVHASDVWGLLAVAACAAAAFWRDRGR